MIFWKVCSPGKFEQQLSWDDEEGAEDEQSGSSRDPGPSAGRALFRRVEGRAAAGRGQGVEPSRVKLRCARQTRPCASCWQQTGSFRRVDADKKDSCSEARSQEAKTSKKPRVCDFPLKLKKKKKNHLWGLQGLTY